MGIRFYQNGDKQKIQVLYERINDRQTISADWEWKYLNAPGDKNPWILIFEEKNQIIGHISLSVFEVYVDGEVKTAAYLIKPVVDPEYVDQTIEKQLKAAMLTHAKQAGISILYGFPKEKDQDEAATYVANISRFYMVLKPWKIAASINNIAKPFKIFDGIYQANRLKRVKPQLPTNYKIEAVEQCDERFNELAEKTKQLKPFIIKRDAAFLNWRYLKRPGHDYKIFALTKEGQLQGYVVIKKETIKKKKGDLLLGFVIDWLAMDDEKNWEYLMQTALTYLEDTDLIQAWSFRTNPIVNKMHYYGLKERDQPASFFVHNLDTIEKVENADNWWMTQGDVDSF